MPSLSPFNFEQLDREIDARTPRFLVVPPRRAFVVVAPSPPPAANCTRLSAFLAFEKTNK